MLETSKDILYLVLAFCILWFTAFLCWFLYYLVRLVKQANETVEDIRQHFARVTSIMGILKNKMFTEGVKKIFSFVENKAKGKKRK